jgi:hypothetical protein
MLTSKNGKDEHAAKNNHNGIMRIIDFSLFTAILIKQNNWQKKVKKTR